MSRLVTIVYRDESERFWELIVHYESLKKKRTCETDIPVIYDEKIRYITEQLLEELFDGYSLEDDSSTCSEHPEEEYCHHHHDPYDESYEIGVEW